MGRRVTAGRRRDDPPLGGGDYWIAATAVLTFDCRSLGSGAYPRSWQLALRVGRGEVGQEVLDDRRLVGRQTLAADDLVGHQQRGVGAGLGSGVLQVKAQVIAAALDLGLRHSLGYGLTCQLDRATATVQLGHAQVVVLRVAPLDVGDGVLRAGDGLSDAGGLVLALAGSSPGLGRLVLPGAVAGLGEELRGVLRGAGLVGAEEHRDVRGWVAWLPS